MCIFIFVKCLSNPQIIIYIIYFLKQFNFFLLLSKSPVCSFDVILCVTILLTGPENECSRVVPKPKMDLLAIIYGFRR